MALRLSEVRGRAGSARLLAGTRWPSGTRPAPTCPGRTPGGQRCGLLLRCPAAKVVAAATAPATPAGGGAAALRALEPPTQDPQVIWDALAAPVVTALGGEASWQFYLASRLLREVVAVVVAVVAGYWLLLQLAQNAHSSSEALTDPKVRRTGGAGSEPGAAPGGSELLRMAAVALTGGQARLFLGCVLAVNVARNTTYILDAFITKFNPRLPNDWLDDAVRLLVQSLTPLDAALTKLSLIGTALFGCAVLLKWKDVMVSYFVHQYIDNLDKGQELVQSFVNPASNLLNWVVILLCAAWLAAGLGVSLKPLLAVGGASGIIIGLATQQVLGNFVSGLNIFLARPFVAGEFIYLVSQAMSTQTQVCGRVIRVDPMRTLLATEDGSTITVPNQVIAASIVVNRSRPPHWSVGSPSPLLANPRELRWRMKLSHSALGADQMKELESRINLGLAEALPGDKVRFSPAVLEVVRFTEAGAEVTAKVNLAWRMRGGQKVTEMQEKQEARETIMQNAMLSMHKVVRGCDGGFLAA